MASKFKQDMPPPGGYGPIEWAKSMPKRGWGGYRIFAAIGTVSAIAFGIKGYELKNKRKFELEMNDTRIALDPLILAERQRMYLRHLRANREEETELMKDVPGWEAGKWEGEPVFHNEANRFHHVPVEEYYMHNRWRDMSGRIFEKLKH